MSRRKPSKEQRRILKRAGLGRQFKEMGALACALEAAKGAPRVPGYAVEPDVACGAVTRRRVRRERWNRRARCMRRMLVFSMVYGGSLLVFLLVVGLGWELVCRWLE